MSVDPIARGMAAKALSGNSSSSLPTTLGWNANTTVPNVRASLGVIQNQTSISQTFFGTNFNNLDYVQTASGPIINFGTTRTWDSNINGGNTVYWKDIYPTGVYFTSGTIATGTAAVTINAGLTTVSQALTPGQKLYCGGALVGTIQSYSDPTITLTANYTGATLTAQPMGALSTLAPVWVNLDTMITRIQGRSVNSNIIFNLAYCPAWLNTLNTGIGSNTAGLYGYPPLDLASSGSLGFNTFVTALATRYAGKITHYELWNEPNGPYWGGTITQFSQMIAPVYNIIKSIDPRATILSPPMGASVSSISGGSGSTTPSFEGLFALGMGSYIDALSTHCYPWQTPPQPPEYLMNMVQQTNYVALAYNVQTPLFVTEFSSNYAAGFIGGTCTISNASPCVVTVANEARAGSQVIFSTTGSLPSPLVAGNTYYVSSSGLTTSSFKISTSPGGSPINTTTAGSGTQTAALYDPAYLAVDYIIGSANVASLCWYSYGNDTSLDYLQNVENAPYNLSPTGLAYQTVENWLLNATWVNKPARVNPLTSYPPVNLVRNVVALGALTGTVGSSTLPTNWSLVSAAPSGITYNILAVGPGYIDVQISGTTTSTGQALILNFEASGIIPATQNTFVTVGINVALIGGSLNNFGNIVVAWEEYNSGGSGLIFTEPVTQFYPTAYNWANQNYQAMGLVQQSTAASVVPTLFINYGTSAVNAIFRIGMPTMDLGHIWQGDIILADGNQARVVWDSSGGVVNSTYYTKYSNYQDIAGNVHAVSGGSFSLSNSPVLLYNTL